MKITQKQFTGKENHSVTHAEAIDFIRRCRAQTNPYKTTGCYFDGQVITALLDQPEAVGLRYYYGVTEDDRKVLVLVGTNAERQNIIGGEPVKLSTFNPAFTALGEYDPDQIDHRIALEDAARLSAHYRSLKQPQQPKGGFFGKQALEQILVQQDCVGIRFLFGANTDATPVMVLVGVDQYGADMFFGHVMEFSALCPPFCGNDDILNSGVAHVSGITFDADLQPALSKAV